MATSSDGLSLNSTATITITNNGSPTLSSTVHVNNVSNSVDDTDGIYSNVSDTTTTTATTTIHPTLEQITEIAIPQTTVSNKQLMLYRGFKDTACNILRNCNSLPLFVYTTTPTTRITSADGIGVGLATILKNDSTKVTIDAHSNGVDCMDCLPQEKQASNVMVATSSSANSVTNSATPLAVGYSQQIKNAHLLSSHHTPYTNHYALHHADGSHTHLHSEQTKSLQELQHEVGALLEFRDLVIETFPDLKHKMVSMSSSASVSNSATAGALTSATNTLTNGSSLASRREWEPGIRVKRKISQKDISTSASNSSTTTTTPTQHQPHDVVAELNCSSLTLTRSRSNSHSGKKEPKSGGGSGSGSGSGENNGSVVQDSGFSTETSSSKDGHSASSTNGVITGPNASNRLSCLDTNDELLNLLDVIHRKSNRLREEMEHLQNYERQSAQTSSDGAMCLLKSHSGSNALTPKTFREHVERLNKEDIKQLRKERDRLLDKLAEMEAETLTGRIKATQMNNQLEELVSVKKDLEEQLKMAMAQKLELSSRVQQLQQQQQQKSSSSDSSSQRNFLSSATTVFSNTSHLDSTRRPHTFQPVVLEQEQLDAEIQEADEVVDSSKQTLGRLDGVVSTPEDLLTKCRTTDSKRFTAILLESNVLELRRHLLTLTVQNQVLTQKLDQTTKSKTSLVKKLDKSKEKIEDLCFQLEEKNIELAGTQAQLRILEARLNTNTPSSAHTSSYLQHSSSQHEYETNRSSTSTILTLSRRGNNIDSTHYNDVAHGVTQISTPSMKAMVPLPMDDLQQQHSSSTESAQDTRQTGQNRTMSRSVDNSSPFDERQAGRVQQTAKKFGGASKPSKIPLPGSKSSNYFAGKPPSGRPLSSGIVCRSPPSVNTSNSSNRSSLSRSTGNLLYSKSPNSLKRNDSAQSIRKENNSLLNSNNNNNNNSRTSNTSTTMAVATIKSQQQQQQQQQKTAQNYGATTPSTAKIIQTSPLPKHKRESLTSRVRHLDSLSRVHKSFEKEQEVFSTPGTEPNTNTNLISSTPKTALNARKTEWPMGANSNQNFPRRITTTNSSTLFATRRFSSASGMSGLSESKDQKEQHSSAQQQASDSDSGKVFINKRFTTRQHEKSHVALRKK